MRHNSTYLMPRGALNTQTGATLIVALVILTVVTVLGLASIRSSNLELRMAASARDRAVAFQAAESAISRVEQSIGEQPYPLSSFTAGCSGNKCFNPTCENGLCFIGEYDASASRSLCRLAPPGATSAELTPSWKRNSSWDNAAEMAVMTTATTAGTTTTRNIEYLVEFLCFVPRSEQVTHSASGAPDSESMVPLYRITARADGEAERATVVLQSVFRAGE